MQNHDVHVYTTNVDGTGTLSVPIGVPVSVDGVSVRYFPTSLGRRLYRSPQMRDALRSNLSNFDILHLHSVFLWPTSVAAHMARKQDIPYVISPRGMLVRELIRRKSSFPKRAWISLFERRNLENAAAVHLTSDLEASELKSLGFNCGPLAVIANGIDIPCESRSQQKSERSAVGHLRRPYVLFLGRINWKKGLDRLILAMQDITAADLLIAGNDDENYRRDLDELARQCAVSHRVRFFGPADDAQKWRLLSLAELVVLPSYSENFGNVVLEAMAASRAVLVTPEVGLASVVKETGCGAIARGDPESIGLEVNRLLADHELRRKMGDAGRRAVEAKYTWAIVTKQMLDVYVQALKA
jgi:glycosyltransferase involved in cell wall biosynthesis